MKNYSKEQRSIKLRYECIVVRTLTNRSMIQCNSQNLTRHLLRNNRHQTLFNEIGLGCRE